MTISYRNHRKVFKSESLILIMKKRLVASAIILMVSLTFVSAGFFEDLFDFFSGRPQKSATDTTDVSVVVGNVAPTINSVSAISDVTPNSGGPINVVFTFDASDPNTLADLNDATAQARFTKGAVTRGTGNNCAKQSDAGNIRTYSCTVAMEFYDEVGVWTVTVSVSDRGSPVLTATDNSRTFNYLIWQDIRIQSCAPPGISCTLVPAPNDKSVTYPTVAPSGGPYTSLQDTRITNLGNFQGPVKVTAFDLKPVSGSDSIPAANFNAAGRATYGNVCTTGAAAGTALVATQATTIVASNLPRGPTGSNIEDLRYCLRTVPPIASQTYSTSNTGSQRWVIGI